MNTLLEHLFQHNLLSRQEAHDLLLEIADYKYPEAQVAALLTVFRMRDIHVEELLGFRDALIERACHIDLSEFHPLTLWVQAATARTPSISLPALALS